MFKRSLISTAIVSSLLLSPFTVNANSQKPDTTDSVREWGKWAKQYATAAGGEINTNSLSFGSFTNSNSGRSSQNEPEIVQSASAGCGAGVFCGFTTIESGEIGQQEQIDLAYNDNSTAQEVGRFDLAVDPGYLGQGELTGRFSVEGNDGFSLNSQELQGYSYFWGSDEQLGIDGGEGSLSTGGDEVSSTAQGVKYLAVTGTKGTFLLGVDLGNLIPNMFANQPYYPWGGWYSDQFGNAVINYNKGEFVGGVTTSLAQLNDFVSNLNGTEARYLGMTLDQGSFGVEINFGTNTWNAGFSESLNTGDSFVVTNGSIDGINFVANSDNLSAIDGVVTGTVEGALFGSDAQMMAGMVDIEKDVGGDAIDRRTVFVGIESSLINN